MQNEFISYLKAVVLPLVIISLILTIFLTGLIYPLAEYRCLERTKSFESKYTFWAGCQIKHKEYWIDYEKFRIVE